MEVGSYPRIPITVMIQLLCGGFINQFGWLFFGFGMIFVWIFVGNMDFSFLTFHGQKDFAQGTIISVRETGASVNEEPVLEHYFSFSDRDGVNYENVSYSTGDEYPEGSEVTIEYLVRNPQRSRIEGMRMAQFGPLVLFVCIFPLVGLPFIIYGIIKGVKRITILRRGVLTKGKLVSKYATNTSINDQPVYKLTFQFFDERGKKYRAVTRTHLPEKLEDEAEESLVYDESSPSDAVLVDDLPGGASVDQMGELYFAKPFRGLLALIVPGVMILGHGTYLVHLLFR
jgi:hypothetical protein